MTENADLYKVRFSGAIDVDIAAQRQFGLDNTLVFVLVAKVSSATDRLAASGDLVHTTGCKVSDAQLVSPDKILDLAYEYNLLLDDGDGPRVISATTAPVATGPLVPNPEAWTSGEIRDHGDETLVATNVDTFDEPAALEDDEWQDDEEVFSPGGGQVVSRIRTTDKILARFLASND